jgi:hypothetical protein
MNTNEEDTTIQAAETKLPNYQMLITTTELISKPCSHGRNSPKPEHKRCHRLNKEKNMWNPYHPYPGAESKHLHLPCASIVPTLVQRNAPPQELAADWTVQWQYDIIIGSTNSPNHSGISRTSTGWKWVHKTTSRLHLLVFANTIWICVWTDGNIRACQKPLAHQRNQ